MRQSLGACRVLKSKEAWGAVCDFLKQTVNMFMNYVKTLIIKFYFRQDVHIYIYIYIHKIQFKKYEKYNTYNTIKAMM